MPITEDSFTEKSGLGIYHWLVDEFQKEEEPFAKILTKANISLMVNS